MIKEYIITGSNCLNHRVLDKKPLTLKCVQPLDSVWRRSLKPGSAQLKKIHESMHDCVKVDARVWEKIEDTYEEMMKYLINVFAEGVNLPGYKTDMLISIIPGKLLLPLNNYKVVEVLCPFLYIYIKKTTYISTCMI